MTTTETYRIKPLAWRKSMGQWWTETLFGNVVLWQYQDSKFKKYWTCSTCGGSHDSLEAAQLAAESWYRERLLGALEVVT
jgi:hypothetical protein